MSAEPENLEPPPALNKSEEFDFDIPERPSAIEETILEEPSNNDQPPATISMIMQQITKVADQIDKIQPLKPRTLQPADEKPASEPAEQHSTPV
jgi:hypothetical protein